MLDCFLKEEEEGDERETKNQERTWRCSCPAFPGTLFPSPLHAVNVDPPKRPYRSRPSAPLLYHHTATCCEIVISACHINTYHIRPVPSLLSPPTVRLLVDSEGIGVRTAASAPDFLNLTRISIAAFVELRITPVIRELLDDVSSAMRSLNMRMGR